MNKEFNIKLIFIKRKELFAGLLYPTTANKSETGAYQNLNKTIAPRETSQTTDGSWFSQINWHKINIRILWISHRDPPRSWPIYCRESKGKSRNVNISIQAKKEILTMTLKCIAKIGSTGWISEYKKTPPRTDYEVNILQNAYKDRQN